MLVYGTAQGLYFVASVPHCRCRCTLRAVQLRVVFPYLSAAPSHDENPDIPAWGCIPTSMGWV